jgi:dolichol-phosphate mannosyltransferase
VKEEMKELLIIIPAYNEEASIEEVVRKAMKNGDVCVVDDGSKDRTREIVEGIPGTVCIHHEKNTHIPGAVLDGMRHAVKKGYPYAVTMDAGMSHDPEEIPNFLSRKEGFDLVLGCRTKKIDTPLYRRLLSWAGNFLYNYALDPSLIVWKKADYSDVTSGYRLYSKRAMELLLNRKMEARSFDFIIEALMFIHRNGLPVTEAPIRYRFSGSSLNGKVVRDALRMLALMIFSRRK